MGLLDQIAQQMLGGEGQGQQPQTAQLSGLAQAVIAMLGSQPNGLQGLLQGFQRAGLDDVVRSWISTGQNQAISGAQLQDALGSDRIASLSQQAGLTPQQGVGALAQLLPSLIDQLTPNGQVPEQSQIGQLGGNLLRALMR